MRAILTQISLKCKNFSWLYAHGVRIGKKEALAIVTFLPKIKQLYLGWVCMDRECLVIKLQGCKELVHLDVRDCVGFKVEDEILKLTSHIGTFKYGCSTAKPDDDDALERLDPRGIGLHSGF